MSTDKPTYEERLASTKPGCTCAAHCQHVWGDQAEDAEGLELITLRARANTWAANSAGWQERAEKAEALLKAAAEAIGYRPPSETLLESINALREDSELWLDHTCNSVPWS